MNKDDRGAEAPVTEELLRQAGQALADKKADMERLARSGDGLAVRSMLDRDGSLTRAVENGDLAALQARLGDVLSTEAGARLARQLASLLE